MTRYASNTSVSTEKSRAEIEQTVKRYGADQFINGWAEDGRRMIGFRCEGRMVRFVVGLPAMKDFRYTPKTEQWRSDSAMKKAWEQACRQRWRALALCIKAKLEAVESGITTFEDEFLAHIVLPDGQTAGAWLRPQIAHAYEHGDMPALLPGMGETG